jgi:hypothetical protein
VVMYKKPKEHCLEKNIPLAKKIPGQSVRADGRAAICSGSTN